MSTAAISAIIDEIGEDRITERLKVGREAVRKVRSNGRFPASWYPALELMAARPLPRVLFNFKGVDRP